MNRMSTMVINYFVKRNVIEEENKEIYEYGFKILIFKLLYLLGMVAVCVLLQRNLMHFFLYYGCYMSIRKYSGGYHASSMGACFITFLVTYLLLDIFIMIGLNHYQLILFVIGIGSSFVIYLRSPIDCANKRLSNVMKKKHQKKTLYMLMVWLLIMLGLILMNQIVYALIICYCMIVISCFMFEKE